MISFIEYHVIIIQVKGNNVSNLKFVLLSKINRFMSTFPKKMLSKTESGTSKKGGSGMNA
jgi:hypothetical protein